MMKPLAPHHHRRLGVALLVLVMAPLTALLAAQAWRRWSAHVAYRAVFGPVTAASTRPLRMRLSHPRLAAHQPHAADCTVQDCRVTFTHAALAKLERLGDVAGLATAYALAGERERALALLDRLPPSAARESDRAVLLSSDEHRTDEALEAIERALEHDPKHGPALWNRAIIIDDLDLPRAAAAAYRRVAALGEPGWSAEANARAEALELRRRSVDEAYRRASANAESITRGVLPSPDVIASHPDVVRLYFFVAARETPEGELRQVLRSNATALDRAFGTTSLRRLVEQRDVLQKMYGLRQSRTIADAEDYARLAESTEEPWLRARGLQTLGQAHARAGDIGRAAAAFERAIPLCERHGFPQLCAENKTLLAHIENQRRHIPRAKKWALEAMHLARASALTAWEGQAVVQLAVAENYRERFFLSAAYAEDAAGTPDCRAMGIAREILAKTALSLGNSEQAMAHLAAVKACGAGEARFRGMGLAALLRLAMDPRKRWPHVREWLEEALTKPTPGATHGMRLARRLIAARAQLHTDRPAARAAIDAVLAETEAHGMRDVPLAMVRIEALSALAIDAGSYGNYAGVLAQLAKAQGLTGDRPCTLAVAVLSGSQVEVARTQRGQLVGHTRWLEGRGRRRLDISAGLVDALRGCEEVGVIAAAPVLGSSKLLPDEIAWSYVRRDERPGRFDDHVERLVIHDVSPPPQLGLSRLLATPHLAATGAAESIVRLSGAEATPRATLVKAASADLVEWHVHGVVDPDVSDAAALALSVPSGGRVEDSLLTANDIFALQLPRRPGVILGACRAGLSAQYGAYQWSLPLAFVAAGARWVIASPTPVEDVEAPAFFSAVWRRIRAGASPAAALRDERLAERWKTSYQGWTRDVVVFQ